MLSKEIAMWLNPLTRFYTKKEFSQKNRFFAVIFAVVFIFALILSRLFYLQAIKYSVYAGLAGRQQNFIRILEPKRGDIFLRSKTGELAKAATTQVGASLYLNMKLLKEPEKIFEILNRITPLDKNLFEKAANKKEDPYEIIKRKVSFADAEKISFFNLPGVGLEEERWRYYPAENLASHAIGFVSQPPQNIVGQYGIEKYFDETLRGSAKKISGDRSAKGIVLAFASAVGESEEAGQDIVLTLEPGAQKEAEITLLALKKKWNGTSGGIIILEPKTGKIIALAAEPSFNPGEYQKEKNLEVFLNPFAQKIFELGSVFKPLTMAAALNEGVLTADTTYIDKGEIKIGNRVIKNFDGKARGIRTMTQVLEESLNTGAVFAMERLGGENLKNYFYKFGLGERTGIELPGELKGDLSNLESGREIEFATASFGQGIAVTPMEFVMALASLANGGKLMEPHITESKAPKIIRETIKAETSHQITAMLVEVVDKALAGGKVKMDRYSIAAKTGTAQIPASRISGPGAKGYSEEYLHSFFGYFPAYDPKFLIFIFLERPQGVKYASQSISDSFRQLVEFLINYYTIPPDR